MKAIEPSEILTEGSPPEPSSIHPYLRLIGRAFDYALFFVVLHFFASPQVFSWMFKVVPVQFAAWIPVETLFLWLWGTTPGKWLLRTEVHKGYAKRLPILCALRRSLGVWARGIGLGIPVLNVLCMTFSYYRLTSFRMTSWDRDEGTLVIHHYLPQWRFLCTVGLTLVGMGFYWFYV